MRAPDAWFNRLGDTLAVFVVPRMMNPRMRLCGNAICTRDEIVIF